MIEKSTIQRVLELFFENPSRQFHLRELARRLKLSLPTIIAATDALSREKLITKAKGPVLTLTAANRENPRFIRLKRVHNLRQLYESGLVDALSSFFTHPQAIILFGSYSRGEDIEKSDIDIAVFTAKSVGMDTSPYGRALKRSISVHALSQNKMSEEFRKNLLNGIVVEGSW